MLVVSSLLWKTSFWWGLDLVGIVVCVWDLALAVLLPVLEKS